MAGIKVAVVTGSNKGVGLAIVRGLCKQFDGHVYLTARDVTRGHQAVLQLQAEGLYPCFHQLDITDADSIERLKQHLLKNYGGIDVLINNVGVLYQHDTTASFQEQTVNTMKTNFWGTMRNCKMLSPILRPHARVANLASYISAHALARCSHEIKQRFLEAQTIEDVEKLITEFEEAAMKGTHKDKGFPDTAYGISKLGVTIGSMVHQKAFDKDTSRTDIIVNSCCPGFVSTDMTRNNTAGRSPDEAARTPIYLALLPSNSTSPRGNFLEDSKIRPFEASEEDRRILAERTRSAMQSAHKK